MADINQPNASSLCSVRLSVDYNYVYKLIRYLPTYSSSNCGRMSLPSSSSHTEVDLDRSVFISKGVSGFICDIFPVIQSLIG